MPIKRSAFKALRQSQKRAKRNHTVKHGVKTIIKDSIAAITKNEADVVKQVQQACKAIDKAVQHGVLHANTAARKKSRLMKRFNTILKK